MSLISMKYAFDVQIFTTVDEGGLMIPVYDTIILPPRKFIIFDRGNALIVEEIKRGDCKIINGGTTLRISVDGKEDVELDGEKVIEVTKKECHSYGTLYLKLEATGTCFDKWIESLNEKAKLGELVGTEIDMFLEAVNQHIPNPNDERRRILAYRAKYAWIYSVMMRDRLKRPT